MRQLVYQVCYTRYHVSFYLWWIGSVLKYCKVPKYYDQDCRQLRVSELIAKFDHFIRSKILKFSLSANQGRWHLLKILYPLSKKVLAVSLIISLFNESCKNKSYFSCFSADESEMCWRHWLRLSVKLKTSFPTRHLER